MLWELLVAIGAVMFVVVPIQTARALGAGMGGIVLAVGSGLILAAGYELVVHRVAEQFDKSLQRRSEATQNWHLRLMYLGVTLVPIVVLICGVVLTRYLR